MIEAKVTEVTPSEAARESASISIDDIDIDDAAEKFLARFKERAVLFILELQRLIQIASEAAA